MSEPIVYWVARWQYDRMLQALANEGLPATGEQLNAYVQAVIRVYDDE